MSDRSLIAISNRLRNLLADAMSSDEINEDYAESVGLQREEALEMAHDNILYELARISNALQKAVEVSQ